MGSSCAVERKIQSSHQRSSYSLSLTGIASYDKIYRECQKHADQFEELKLKFEAAKADLVSITGVEMVTQEVYAEAINILIINHASSHYLDASCLQIADKYPFLLVNSQSGSDLIKRLHPAIKFITLVEKTSKELMKLYIHLQSEKRMTRVLFDNYEENAIKAGLEDFEKVLGREIAKKNFHILSSLVLEAKAYNEELETTSQLLPKHLAKVRETILRKASRENVAVNLPEKNLEALPQGILVD